MSFTAPVANRVTRMAGSAESQQGDWEPGDLVRLSDGPYADFPGEVLTVDRARGFQACWSLHAFKAWLYSTLVDQLLDRSSSDPSATKGLSLGKMVDR